MVRVLIWRVGQRRLEVWTTETGARSAVLLDGTTSAGCWPLPSRRALATMSRLPLLCDVWIWVNTLVLWSQWVNFSARYFLAGSGCR